MSIIKNKTKKKTDNYLFYCVLLELLFFTHICHCILVQLILYIRICFPVVLLSVYWVQKTRDYSFYCWKIFSFFFHNLSLLYGSKKQVRFYWDKKLILSYFNADWYTFTIFSLITIYLCCYIITMTKNYKKLLFLYLLFLMWSV